MNVKIVATNKKAYFDYFIEETYEAGISLSGAEIKSVRLGKINLKDGFCLIRNGEMYLENVHISPYEKGSVYNTEPTRRRVLLLHKAEILKINVKVQQKGYTLIPTKAYLKQGLLKIEVGVAKGKELQDKRQTIAEKENRRSLDRVVKEYNSKGD
ncbi:MAG: SsrA-binding protein SmpB [Clostridia bacterium]